MNTRNTGLADHAVSTTDEPDMCSSQGSPEWGETRSYAIRAERVDVQVGDGSSMGAYLARPAISGPFPGVVVGMELFGVDAAVRDVCDRLAGLGFVALAPDLHHRTSPDTELARDPAGRERGFELLELMTRATVLQDVRACIDFLQTSGSEYVSMVGLSLGGHVAYLAATEFDLAAVAVFFGRSLPTTDIPLS